VDRTVEVSESPDLLPAVVTTPVVDGDDLVEVRPPRTVSIRVASSDGV
jgi:hypothetical protein